MKAQNILCIIPYINEAAEVQKIKALEGNFNISLILIYKYKTPFCIVKLGF